MRLSCYWIAFLFPFHFAFAQPTGWSKHVSKIDASSYHGVAMGNGVIGFVSTPEPMRFKDVVMNGLYDTDVNGRVSRLLVSLNHVNVNLEVDGLRVGTNIITQYHQELDMRHGKFITSFKVANNLIVKHKSMSVRHLPYVTLTIIEITALKDSRVTPATVIEAPAHLWGTKNFYSVIDRPHAVVPLLTTSASSPSGKHVIAASTSFIFEEPLKERPTVVHEDWDTGMHLAKFTKELKAGETYQFSVVGAMASSKQYTNPLGETERLAVFANLEGTKRLETLHDKAWSQLWGGDVVVEGDSVAQSDIRLAIYNLYSFTREGLPNSVPPMGLSGMGFSGHIFWDSEFWMFPPLLVLHPEIAKSMLEYRFTRMEAARQNAFAHGYQGVMFPWESADSGDEETPVWALTGPFQHHITGCVGWSFWKYYQVTHDRVWLRDSGYPMLKEVAMFWASRVDRKGPGRFEINNVIGANEFLENIDNNAFTNGIAITTLRYAAQAARELGLKPDPDWEYVASNIPIVRFPDGTIRENETYNGEDIKQADANLLSYPLSIVTDMNETMKNVKYYQTRISRYGPAMSHSILSTLYSRANDPQQAYALFLKGYKPNQLPPFNVLSETAGGNNPFFVTGAGGMLQAVIFGFGGIQIDDKGIIQLKTKLPGEWKGLKIKTAGRAGKIYSR